MVKTSGTDGTGRGLVEFWDWVAEKGLMKKNTAGALKAVCSKVLAVDDDPDSIDVRTLDIEDLLRRFENLRKRNYNPRSLSTYKARFRKAVAMYLAHLDNPSGWRPDIRERSGSVGRRGPTPPGTSVSTSGGDAHMMQYPFPLRPGVVARLELPTDLKRREVARLTSFLNMLTEEEQLASAPNGLEE